MVSQVIYLEKMDRDNEAIRSWKRCGPALDQIQNSDIILNMYEMQALFISNKKCMRKRLAVLKRPLKLRDRRKITIDLLNYGRRWRGYTST